MFLCMQKIRMIPLLRPKKVVECVSEYISFSKKTKQKQKQKQEDKKQKKIKNKREYLYRNSGETMSLADLLFALFTDRIVNFSWLFI